MILTTGWRKFNFEFDFDSRFIPFDWFDLKRFIVIPKYATLNILKFKVIFEFYTLFLKPRSERPLLPDFCSHWVSQKRFSETINQNIL